MRCPNCGTPCARLQTDAAHVVWKCIVCDYYRKDHTVARTRTLRLKVEPVGGIDIRTALAAIEPELEKIIADANRKIRKLYERKLSFTLQYQALLEVDDDPEPVPVPAPEPEPEPEIESPDGFYVGELAADLADDE